MSTTEIGPKNTETETQPNSFDGPKSYWAQAYKFCLKHHEEIGLGITLFIFTNAIVIYKNIKHPQNFQTVCEFAKKNKFTVISIPLGTVFGSALLFNRGEKGPGDEDADESLRDAGLGAIVVSSMTAFSAIFKAGWWK